jgi:cytochrome c biogenesis protein CcdA/thiol-disulfide isomerase/thioredoxin
MNKKLTIVSKLFVLFGVLALVTSVISVFSPKISYADEKIQVNFFYGDGCPHCAKVEPVIDVLKNKFPQVLFNSYEIYHNQDNALSLYKLYDEYKVPQEDRGGVPIVFIGSEYFMGDKPIIDNLENKIIANLSLIPNKTDTEVSTTPIVSSQEPKVADTGQSNTSVKKSYSLWAIAGAAVVDSINPCAIAVLLILLTTLMIASGNKKRALYGGLAFTLSIYITYFLFGLGLLQLIAITNIAGIIAKIVGVIALIIGLANIKDFFFYGGGGFVMEIPRNWRPILKKILNGVTSPLGAFFAGFVVTLFELPCTGGPYFFVLGLLSQAESIVSIIPTLLFYNVVFILPLLLIVFAVYFGVSSIEKAEAWKEKNLRVLHLIAGIIMIALGIWVFFI